MAAINVRMLIGLVLLCVVGIAFGNDIDLVFDVLIRGLDHVQNSQGVSNSDFSELRNVCKASDNANCNTTVELLIKSIKFINDREPNPSAKYYPFLISGLILLKIVIVTAVTYFIKRRYKRRAATASVSDTTSVDIELRSNFINSVKTAHDSPDSTIKRSSLISNKSALLSHPDTANVSSQTATTLHEKLKEANNKDNIVRKSLP